MNRLLAIESGSGTVRHTYHNADDGAVWFGADANSPREI